MIDIVPMRIQRKRVAGWRMPPNTVSVTRPGKFGNPFHVTEWLTLACSLKLFENACNGVWNPSVIDHLNGKQSHDVYEAFCQWRKRLGRNHPIYTIQIELHGKNLACFCHLCHSHAFGKTMDIVCPNCQPCHSDILLQVANS